jgi:hypothetical protein
MQVSPIHCDPSLHHLIVENHPANNSDHEEGERDHHHEA